MAVLFVGALATSAALLAAWVDLRLGPRRPRALAVRMGHAAGAFLVLDLTTEVLARLAQPESPPLQRLGVILLVFLPGLLYAFLACLWLLRSLAEHAWPARR